MPKVMSLRRQAATLFQPEFLECTIYRWLSFLPVLHRLDLRSSHECICICFQQVRPCKMTTYFDSCASILAPGPPQVPLSVRWCSPSLSSRSPLRQGVGRTTSRTMVDAMGVIGCSANRRSVAALSGETRSALQFVCSIRYTGGVPIFATFR